MMALAKCVIKFLSVKVLEYPEMTVPEQALETKNYFMRGRQKLQHKD